MTPVQRTSFARHCIGADMSIPRRPRTVGLLWPGEARGGKTCGLAFNNTAGFRLEMEELVKSAVDKEIKSAMKQLEPAVEKQIADSGAQLDAEKKAQKADLEAQSKAGKKAQKADFAALKTKTKLLGTDLAAQKATLVQLEAQKADLAQLDKRLGRLEAKLAVLSVDKVADAASQLANTLIYAADVKLRAVGNAAKKPQSPLRTHSVAKFKGRLSALQNVNLAVPWASLAEGDLAAFNCKSDKMIVFGTATSHPPNLDSLDTQISDALKLISPELRDHSAKLAHACFLVERYHSDVRPVLVEALSGQPS